MTLCKLTIPLSCRLRKLNKKVDLVKMCFNKHLIYQIIDEMNWVSVSFTKEDDESFKSQTIVKSVSWSLTTIPFFLLLAPSDNMLCILGGGYEYKNMEIVLLIRLS